MTIESFVKKYILLENNDNDSDAKADKGYLAQHPLFNQVKGFFYIVSYVDFNIDLFKMTFTGDK